VHTEPDRFSPSFAQIPEGGTVDVLGHQLTPRKTVRPKAVLATKVTPARATRKGSRKSAEAALPLPPTAAPLPAGLRSATNRGASLGGGPLELSPHQRWEGGLGASANAVYGDSG
jgi:hypothetical protein